MPRAPSERQLTSAPVRVPAFLSAEVRSAAAVVTLSTLAADQLSKSLVLAARPGNGKGLLAVRLVRNTGASFGLGAGHPVLVTLVSAVVIAVVSVILIRTRSKAASLFLAAVLGGALGNLADRFFRSPGLGRGAVIDWIHLQWYPPSFNIADLAIRVGVIGAVAAMLSHRVRPGSWLRFARTEGDRDVSDMAGINLPGCRLCVRGRGGLGGDGSGQSSEARGETAGEDGTRRRRCRAHLISPRRSR